MHPFSVFGYHVTGSEGMLLLYGVAGLSLLQAGARRTSRRGSDARRGRRQSRQETAYVSRDPDSSTSARPPAHTRQAFRVTARPAATPIRAQTRAAGAGFTCSDASQPPAHSGNFIPNGPWPAPSGNLVLAPACMGCFFAGQAEVRSHG